jgi:hypothetical protein
MSRRRTISIGVAAAVALLVLIGTVWWRPLSRVALAERAMRDALGTGWSGTNEAHRIVQQLPTGEALHVLVDLLRSPEPSPLRLYQRVWSELPDGLRKIVASPTSSGPVEMCAYQWLAEALNRTNVTVDPLIPLLNEKPDLFWNVLTQPLLVHLNAHQEDLQKLVPLLRSKDFNVVNVVSHLVASSDKEGVSEPAFRRLISIVPDDRMSQMANGLVGVTRTPEDTANWLWAEIARQDANRAKVLIPAVRQLELRLRREAGFLGRRLYSTNGLVRLGALQLAASHQSRAAQAFERIVELADSADPRERFFALRACVLVAGSPQCPIAMRTEAARVVHESGDGEAVKAAQERELPDVVKAALAGLRP